MEQSPPPSTRRCADKAVLFERIVESATGFAIYTVDPHGIATSWNRGAECMLGWTEAEMLGHSADRIFTPEDHLAGVPDAERATALAKSRAENERWHLRKDGSRFWGSGLLMPLAGEPTEFVKILRDLTDRHHAEQRLRESEELFRILATHIPQLVFQTRPNGERTWGSPQWVAFTGLQLEDSLGLKWLDAVHPDDREATQAAWAEARATGEYLVEHRICRASIGEYHWHQTQARPIGERSGDGLWVGTSTDIHHLRGLQDRQAVLVAELQHRTRNLLSVIQSIARQVIRKRPSAPEFEAEFGDRLAALGRVQNLLALTNHHSLDLRMLIEAELKAYADGDLESGKVQIDGPPAVVPGEVAQTLALALHELVTNAVKHGALAQPSGQIAVSWRAEPQREHRVMVVEWRESGVTMPEGARRKGYGSELIERALPYQLKAETRLEFGADGVHCMIAVPVAPAKEGSAHG